MRLALSIALFASLAAIGCGGDEETTTTAPTSAETTAETTTPAETTTTEDQDSNAGEASGGIAAESPGAEPESAIEAFFVSGDPDLVCGELATESLLANAYGDEKGCRHAQAPGASANAIEIKEIDVEDDRAEAVVIPEGGPNDGFEHEVKLVYVSGAWQVDSLEADIPAGP